MATIVCKVCNTQNNSDSAKCEDCKSLLPNKSNYHYKEHAYHKRKLLEPKNCEESPNDELIDDTSIFPMVQVIKEEPEFQIEPEILLGMREEEAKTEGHVHHGNERYMCTRIGEPKRNSNFSKSEENCLLRLVLKHKNILENKKTDAALTKLKEAAWRKLTEEYNASPRNASRSTKALRYKYKNIKSMIRKNKLYYRSKAYLNSDEPPPEVSNEDANPLLGVLAEVITLGVNPSEISNHQKDQHCLSELDSNYLDSKTQKCSKKSKDSLKKDKDSESTVFKCDLCNDSFADNHELKSHQSLCDIKKKFHCEVCKIFVSRKAALRKHEKCRQHKFNLENPPKEDKLKYMCVVCDEKFSLQIHLTNHKKIHIDENKLINERTQIEKVDGRTKYVCRTCGKSSSNRACHAEHLRVHTKEKPAKCDLCGSAFTTRSSLIRHMKTHSEERPYKCNICEETYRHKRNLQKHLFKHTGQRPFKCKDCDKTFAVRHTLNDHVRLLHTGEAPYQCEDCKESFKTAFLLNCHRRAKHKIDSKSRIRIIYSEVASDGNYENRT